MSDNRREAEELQRHPGETALAALNVVLEQCPARDTDELALAIQGLSVLRDHLIAAYRRAPARQTRDRLDRVNAVLSVASHAEYPLVGARWNHVQAGRDALARLVAELRAG